MLRKFCRASVEKGFDLGWLIVITEPSAFEPYQDQPYVLGMHARRRHTANAMRINDLESRLLDLERRPHSRGRSVRQQKDCGPRDGKYKTFMRLRACRRFSTRGRHVGGHTGLDTIVQGPSAQHTNALPSRSMPPIELSIESSRYSQLHVRRKCTRKWHVSRFGWDVCWAEKRSLLAQSRVLARRCPPTAFRALVRYNIPPSPSLVHFFSSASRVRLVGHLLASRCVCGHTLYS